MIYETTISYIAIDRNGNDKTVKERYIVDNAQTFGECEDIMLELCQDFTDLDVVAIKRSKLQEFANQRTSQQDRIFVADLEDTFVDDDGNEKEMKYSIAFYALDISAAYSFITEYIKQGYNMSLVALRKTKFVSYYNLK